VAILYYFYTSSYDKRVTPPELNKVIHPLRTVNVTRYIQPLREGGSLPALAEADDDFKYVLKFKGGGHGVKTLIAELIGGEIARALGLKVPELVFAFLDEAFGRTEGDEEIQDLLQASQGLNLALHFLSGAINFDPVVTSVDAKLASQIVWLDSLITNVDRTFRNTNMLIWNKELWLIDHGSCLYFHYNWPGREGKSTAPFSYIKDHVLLPKAAMLKEVNEEYKQLLTAEKISTIVDMVPAEWLQWPDTEEGAEANRNVYYDFLVTRLGHSDNFTKEAQDARETLI
jgi:hypothetical protein